MEPRSSGGSQVQGGNVGTSASVLNLPMSGSPPYTSKAGTGDLRSISSKPYSRSVDDLSRISSLPPDPQAKFRERVQMYRQGSSQSTTTMNTMTPTPTESTQSHNYPFPPMPISITASSPPTTSSMPSLNTLPALSVNTSLQHSRSQSQNLLSPPQSSPVATRRPSFTHERTRKKSQESTGSNAFGFSFGFGSKASDETLPTGNTEHEQPEATSTDNRSSQIIHMQGFIHRLQTFSSRPLTSTAPVNSNAPLSKGWKPFKTIVKGSKMYFYKPPTSAIAGGIRDLFASGLVEVVEETSDDEMVNIHPPVEKSFESARGSSNGGTPTRRRRVYWGRGTHPELVLEDNVVKRGSGEALVHELVFATTFDDRSLEGPWASFAGAILLMLPTDAFMERGKFEGEYERCKQYYLAGLDDGEREKEEERIRWLDAEYSRLHAHNVADSQVHEPPATPKADVFSTDDLGPRKDSVMALLDSTSPQRSLPLSSSVLGASVTDSPSPSFRSSIEPPGGRPEPLSIDDILRLDVRTIAASLASIHTRDVNSLSNASSSQILNALTLAAGGEAVDTADSRRAVAISEFVGTEEHPHWLSRFILQGLLMHGSSINASISKTHIRASLITKWIRVADLCRENGDAASWHAIQAALCCSSIARMEKSWRRVDEALELRVRTWAMGREECLPIVSCWFDTHIQDQTKNLIKECEREDGAYNVEAMHAIAARVQKISEAAKRCSQKTAQDHNSETIKLAHMFEELRELPEPGNPHLDMFHALSLAAEPRLRGRFAPYFWRTATHSASHPLVPVLFPEPLPTIALLDRDQILMGKGEALEDTSNFEDDLTRILQIKGAGEGGRQRESRNSLGSGNAVTSEPQLGGTVIPVFDGDLLLLVESRSVPTSNERQMNFAVNSRPISTATSGSRPASQLTENGSSEKKLGRTPSLRVTSRAGSNLERKPSLARRSSLPAIPAPTSSFPIPEDSPPAATALRVIVKAGTLDRLVDLLVYGLDGVRVSISDDNGESPLGGTSRPLKVDKQDFANIWWNAFRTFVTPLVFFELLRKRYLAATSRKAVEITAPSQSKSNVIKTLTDWLETGGGSQDVLDDRELFEAVQSFISTLPRDDGADDRDAFVTACDALRQAFLVQSKRPKLTRPVPPNPRQGAHHAPRPQFGPKPPDIDNISAEDLVRSLNALVASAAQVEDFLVTSDLLEIQTLDKTGWFLPHDPSSHFDEVEVQTLHSILQQIEPSTMISELTQETLYKVLPPSIRSFIRAQAIISKWAIIHITAPGIGHRRQARMELLLQAIEVCRPTPDSSVPCVRSFVEAALTSAIISPESRLFQRAWCNVAAARGCQVDSLASLLAKRVNPASHTNLTTDVGWVLERMLEVISLADTLESATEGLGLINFSKRRHLCNLVISAPSEMDRSDFDRLNNMYRFISGYELDFRILQQDALRENGQLSHSQRRMQRPFQRLVVAQQDKNKRDRYLRERLLKEKRHEQQRQNQRQHDLDRAMQAKRGLPPSVKQHRSKRTMSSAFFRVMRPLSTAFISDTAQSPPRLTMAELDFAPTAKPSLVINLADAKAAVFNNPERSYTFQLDTEEGAQYLFQAVSKSEMNKWVTTVNQISRSSASKRLTYLNGAAKLGHWDQLHTRAPVSTRHPTAVFGVPLAFLLQREAGDNEIAPGAVPKIVDQCLTEIEARGLQEVGIYRIAGASSVINSLRDAFDRGDKVDLSSDRYLDINAVCDVVKAWFRQLPEALFPGAYHDVIRVMRIPDFDQRLSEVRKVVRQLPTANYDLLRRLMEHLERVTDFEEHNQMTSQALAIVFSPNVVKAPGDDLALAMANMNYTTQLVKTLITHFHVIFDEADVDQEDEEHDVDSDEPLEVVKEELDECEAESVTSASVHHAINDHELDFEPPAAAA
ncbi:hypothetical protein SISSUDRAFT_1063257 [Sistotremastrum suecicum HHB10207 ss-3]|uniref:Rho GTPase activation protein n=1 Tax=Sistotremastrum suecicum HHB10207 ss-3 TaxID=1314776 RepID=A0A166C0K5_9AGAM|nr:hypothetical protein SISSUDRAFT_1063257 [Sistotremastrum suecicum HHB10207 ss-3]